MGLPRLLLCLGSAALAFDAPFVLRRSHHCGVCRELRRGLPCHLFDACNVINSTVLGGDCAAVCSATVGSAAAVGRRLESDWFDARITKAFGTKPYEQVRVSVVTYEPKPPIAGFFDYSRQFMHKWSQFYLHSAIKTVTPGIETHFDVGVTKVAVKLPRRGEGVTGVLIADPCVKVPGEWMTCTFGNKFDTYTRIPALINAFASGLDTDFWSISGDNWYDRTGVITADIFSKIVPGVKNKLFNAVAGNHDYWVFGAPRASTTEDQCGNGFMQYYAQDSKAAEHVRPGDRFEPFDFSVDPDADRPLVWDGLGLGCNLPAFSNFFWYNQIGNIGMVGQSGAFPVAQTRPFMWEACAWLDRQPGLEVVILFGHWDVSGLGATPEMAMPQWYSEMAAIPGCAKFQQRGMLKFVMGHTHCNDPHPHGQVGAGFRVAGFGMDGCGNFGIPVVDTTAGRVRFWYFDTSSDPAYDQVMACVGPLGWRSCTHLATLWLDEPIARAGPHFAPAPSPPAPAALELPPRTPTLPPRPPWTMKAPKGGAPAPHEAARHPPNPPPQKAPLPVKAPFPKGMVEAPHFQKDHLPEAPFPMDLVQAPTPPPQKDASHQKGLSSEEVQEVHPLPLPGPLPLKAPRPQEALPSTAQAAVKPLSAEASLQAPPGQQPTPSAQEVSSSPPPSSPAAVPAASSKELVEEPALPFRDSFWTPPLPKAVPRPQVPARPPVPSPPAADPSEKAEAQDDIGDDEGGEKEVQKTKETEEPQEKEEGKNKPQEKEEGKDKPQEKKKEGKEGEQEEQTDADKLAPGEEQKTTDKEIKRKEETKGEQEVGGGKKAESKVTKAATTPAPLPRRETEGDQEPQLKERHAAPRCPPDNGGCCADCAYRRFCPANRGCYRDGQAGCFGGLCPPPGALATGTPKPGVLV